MSFFAAVFLFPLITLTLAAGGGLLVERVTGGPIPGRLLVPLGLALMVVLAALPQAVPSVAWTGTWLMLAACVAGLAVGASTLRHRRPDPWAVVAVAATYSIVVAPVLLAGHVAMTGYLLDGTVALQLTAAQHLVEHGREFSMLAPSSLSLWLDGYFSQHFYPLGSQVLLGSLGKLVPAQLPWLYQPLIAVGAGVTALPAIELLRRVGARAEVAAAGGVLVAAPALVAAYAMMGAIKEVLVLPFLILLVALVAEYRGRSAGGPRAVLPLAVTGAAGVGTIGLAFGGWLVPLLALCLIVALLEVRIGSVRPRAIAIQGVVLAAALVLLSAPAVAELTKSLSLLGELSHSNPTLAIDPGNLLEPLRLIQVFGIWLSGEHRIRPQDTEAETLVLIGLAMAAFVLGLGGLARRRQWILLAALASFAPTLWLLTARGTDWLDAKLLVLTSPIVVLVVVLGLLGLAQSGRRIESVLLGAAVAFGVLASNALLYHDTNLTPTARFAELRHIAGTAARRGPTYVADFDEMALYFLRDVAPEGPGFAFRTGRTVRLRNGITPTFGGTYDTDQLPWRNLKQFRLIVLRQGPHHSLPPSAYRRIHADRFYTVWERLDAVAARTVDHLGFGAGRSPSASPDCAVIRRLAALARAPGRRLIVALRPPALRLDPRRARERPLQWPSLRPAGIGIRGAGLLEQRFVVRRPGRFRLWLEGDFTRAMSVSVDGRRVETVASSTGGDRNVAGGVVVPLAAGGHRLTLLRSGGNLRPGDGGAGRLVETVFEREGAQQPPSTWPAAAWRALCKRSDVDWVEVRRA